MLSVVNRIDFALEIGFAIFRIGLLVIKLLAFLVTPLFNLRALGSTIPNEHCVRAEWFPQQLEAASS